MTNTMLALGKQIANLANEQHGWDVFAVGGFVRDRVLAIESKDLDLEVFGPDSVEQLIAFLEQFGQVDAVGKSFGVLKLRVGEIDLDVSLPRTESKEGQGHKGFVVKADGKLTPFEAASRRDFTFNALMLNLNTMQIIDHFGCTVDLQRGILRHTSDHFADDPLRVMRGFQFCGRFELIPTPGTIELSISLLSEFETLAKERIWIEFEKWAVKSSVPSRGLWFLWQTLWITKFPELWAITDIEQDHEWHPEGNVWQHTLHTVDAAAKIATREGLSNEKRLVLMLAALLHDVGKPQTTELCDDGRIRSKAHDKVGAKVAREFLQSINAPKDITDKVCLLISEHMVHVHHRNVSTRTAKRLASRLGDKVSIADLALLVEADHSGRPPLVGGLPEGFKQILELSRALDLETKKPEPLLMGRHLIDLGLKPGPQFSVILSTVFEAQLDEKVNTLDEAVAMAKEMIE